MQNRERRSQLILNNKLKDAVNTTGSITKTFLLIAIEQQQLALDTPPVDMDSWPHNMLRYRPGTVNGHRLAEVLHIERGLINIHMVNVAVIGGSTLATHVEAVAIG